MHFLRRALVTSLVVLGIILGIGRTEAESTNLDRFDFSAQNETVRSVLLRLARVHNASIVVSQGVTGYVTLSLKNVTLRDALTAILEPIGDTYQVRGNVYVVKAGASVSLDGAATTAPTVLALSIIPAKVGREVLKPLFPSAEIRVDARANALVIVAPPSDLQSMRTVLQGIDVKNPTADTTEALSLRTASGVSLTSRLRAAFPKAKFLPVGSRQLLITATPNELTQIKAAVAALDTPPPQPTSITVNSEAVRLNVRAPSDVARSVVSQIPGVRASVAGGAVVLSGPTELVSRAKALIVQLDVPNFGDRYTQIYRVRTVDATSVADLLRRSIRNIDVSVDASLNALAINATAADHARIAEAIAQFDAPASTASTSFSGMPSTGSNGSSEVITLKSYIPGQGQGATDAVTSISAALLIAVPDVKVAQLPTPGQIVIMGSPASVRTAHEFINKVDLIPPLVVLDTEVLEIDESVAKNLGVQLGTAAITSQFTEQQPQATDGATPRLGRFQALTRTPIQFTAQLNLLIQNGKGRVLADPRITTLSGHTATIRAGDTISILTTTSGNAGTIATTQVQSFQTGVTLDITPSVTPDGDIMVSLHPVVNSLIGTNNGVPEISTRDTQTTVHLRDDETLVIGGLIQENETRTTTRIPFLGNLPVIGRAFRNDNVQGQRNELIIVVTPHVVKPGTTVPGPRLTTFPSPQPLPTLPPTAQLPPPVGQLPRTVPVPSPTTLRSAASTQMNPASPMASGTAAASPTPQSPSPSGLLQTNVFVFGSPPQSNFAKPTDVVQILYCTLSPTVAATNGTPVKIAVVTTSNANAVRLMIGSQSVNLAQTGIGQWQASFPFPTTAIPVGQSSITATLLALRIDGSSASIPILLSLAP